MEIFRHIRYAAAKRLEELTTEKMLDVQKKVLSQSRSMMPFSPKDEP